MADTGKTIEEMKAGLARSGYGHAAVVDGVLDMRTVANGPNATALMVLTLNRYVVMRMCPDPFCDCVVEDLKKLLPAVSIVRVKVDVIDG